MPHLTQHVTVEGPLLQVVVGVSNGQARTLRAAGLPIPSELQLLALVDTGASQSCLDVGCVQRLALAQTGRAALLSPAGPAQQYPLHEASLIITHPQMNLALGSLGFAAAPLALQGFEAILGRDVLRGMLVVYDGQANTFTLAF